MAYTIEAWQLWSTGIFIFIIFVGTWLYMLFTSNYWKNRQIAREELREEKRKYQQELRKISVQHSAPKRGRPPKEHIKKEFVEPPKKETLEDTPHKDYVYHKPKWSWNPAVWFNPRVWYKVWLWRRWRKKALKRIVARIQTSPYEVIQLMFKIDLNNSFRWNGGRYVCNEDTAKYNITADMPEYYFHKDCSVSLDVNTPADQIKEAVKEMTLKDEKEGNVPLLEVYHDLDPRVLQNWVEAEAARVALAANAIGQFFKRLFMLVMISVFFTLIFFVAWGFHSNFFARLGG